MRYTLLIAIAVLFFTGCSKSDSAPEISFKSVSPDTYKTGGLYEVPVLTVTLKDGDGNLGDSSFIYLKNLRTNDFDSVALPDLAGGAVKNFKGDVRINMNQYLRTLSLPDTLYFELYLKDNAKTKSNVIRTEKPIYIIP